MASTTLSLTDVLSLAAAIVAIGGAAIGAYRWTVGVYRRTIGSRRDLTRRLNQLGTGVTVRWVEERFGTPVFARSLAQPDDGGQAPSSGLRELIYRTRHAWLQIIADQDDAVARFSITVTDHRFRFSTAKLAGILLRVRLGRSHFASIGDLVEPQGRNLRIGAHDHEYAEAYWFGNPGSYQWFVLSHNDAGTGDFDHPIQQERPGMAQDGVLAFGPRVQVPPFDAAAGYARRFRERTTINTMTVLGPLRQPALLAEPRGPDSNQVRVLVPALRQRWSARLRIRRIRRDAASKPGLGGETAGGVAAAG